MQQINVPAIRFAITGLKAEYHILRHNKKLQTNPLDVGFDLYPSEIDKVTKHGHLSMIWVHTFIHVHIGAGFYGELHDRSSSIDALNGGMIAPGVIDAGFQGEVLIRVWTPSTNENLVSASICECHQEGRAIAQLLVHSANIALPAIPPTTPVIPNGRGDRGFGSTNLLK